MTNQVENQPSRRLACAGCGTEFSCSLSGLCWCSEEAFRLPMPVDGGDCLCPDCLRKTAARAAVNVTSQWNVGAVLLDMDGTLLDTERVYFDSLIAALSAHGYSDDTATLCQAMVGLPGPDCEAMLHARYGERFPLAEISRAFVTNRDEILSSGLPLKSGALELLDALQASECPMAIVTSSSQRTADAHLTLAGIRHRFETILTRDDVARGKPSPDLYLLAASRFGLKPEFCVAVEDSNHGVTAAHAAGAITIMVPDMVTPTEESRTRCAAVLSDLHAVLAMLRTRGGFERRSF
jgi:HAD superfamily hydrolase (TIGR01509 family)